VKWLLIFISSLIYKKSSRRTRRRRRRMTKKTRKRTIWNISSDVLSPMIRRLQTEKKTNLTESPTNKQTDENKNSHVLIKIIIPNEPL